MKLYCVTYTQRDDEVGEHDTVEYFRTKQDALAAIRRLNGIVKVCNQSFYNISLECVELYLRKQEIIEALNLSNRGQSALNAILIKDFDDVGGDA